MYGLELCAVCVVVDQKAVTCSLRMRLCDVMVHQWNESVHVHVCVYV